MTPALQYYTTDRERQNRWKHMVGRRAECALVTDNYNNNNSNNRTKCVEILPDGCRKNCRRRITGLAVNRRGWKLVNRSTGHGVRTAVARKSWTPQVQVRDFERTNILTEQRGEQEARDRSEWQKRNLNDCSSVSHGIHR